MKLLELFKDYCTGSVNDVGVTCYKGPVNKVWQNERAYTKRKHRLYIQLKNMMKIRHWLGFAIDKCNTYSMYSIL
jgi:hypothetical protein